MTDNRRSHEEIEKDFLKLKETDDTELRNKLIEEHLYIAEILAKKYVNKGIEYEDLFQVASYALILAVDRFDVEKGYRFSSYATPTIIGELKRYFRDKGWVIKVPRRIQEQSNRITKAKNVLNQRLGRVPTINEISDFLDLSEEEVLESIEASQVYSPHSIDAIFDTGVDDGQVSLRDFLGEEDETFEEIEFKEFLKSLASDLTDVETKIFLDRYLDNKTQIIIAEELGVSQMTVSRLEKKIIEGMKLKLGDELHGL